MNKDYYAVIMAGGIGSRFWPISTKEFPKQFHDMLGTGRSLLQTTFDRLKSFIDPGNLLILTNERYSSLVLEQLPECGPGQLVLEPAMRNTAPCILLSALKIHKHNPEAVILVAPSDHWIEDVKAFERDIVNSFEKCSQEQVLMTLGIKPDFPNTGYGYIEFDPDNSKEVKKVMQFREKPDYPTARSFLAAGNFLWNAGIFVWKARTVIEAFRQYLPEMYQLFAAGADKLNTKEEAQFIEKNYARASNISVDYGIMEKATNVYVREAAFDWNDLGTWGALHDKLQKDPNDNATVNAVVHLKEANGNTIYTDREKLVVLDGLQDYIVVDREGVLMIFPREKDQDIKTLLGELADRFDQKYN